MRYLYVFLVIFLCSCSKDNTKPDEKDDMTLNDLIGINWVGNYTSSNGEEFKIHLLLRSDGQGVIQELHANDEELRGGITYKVSENIMTITNSLGAGKRLVGYWTTKELTKNEVVLLKGNQEEGFSWSLLSLSRAE